MDRKIASLLSPGPEDLGRSVHRKAGGGGKKGGGGGSFARKIARKVVRAARAARDAYRGYGPTVKGR